MPELPGQPVVQGDLPGDLRRLGGHRPGALVLRPVTEHGGELDTVRDEHVATEHLAGYELDGNPPAFVQHVGVQDVIWPGCQLPLHAPIADDPGEGVDPLQEPAHRARVLTPRGVAALAARLDERHHVHQAAELDVLELVDQGLGHAERGRRQRRELNSCLCILIDSPGQLSMSVSLINHHVAHGSLQPLMSQRFCALCRRDAASGPAPHIRSTRELGKRA